MPEKWRFLTKKKNHCMLKDIMRAARFLILSLLLMLPAATSAAESRYTDNYDGTIKDNLSELVWIKDPDHTPGLAGAMVWNKAKHSCKDLVFGGYGPNVWYLPNIKELQGLVEESSGSPRIDTFHFSCTGEPYWSSTDDTGNGTRAWVVHFGSGELLSYPKLSLMNPIALRARCVRRSQ